MGPVAISLLEVIGAAALHSGAVKAGVPPVLAGIFHVIKDDAVRSELADLASPGFTPAKLAEGLDLVKRIGADLSAS